MSRKVGMHIKTNMKILFLFIAAVLGYVAYISIDIYSYGNVREITKADAVIVLGAGIKRNKPSLVFAERIKHAIWLYKNGYVKKLIFTGGKGAGNKYSDSFIARDYALRHSIPTEDILIEELSTTTQENIFYAAEIGKNYDLSTFLIVSDPLHMKRAMLMAKDNNLEAYPSPTPSTKYKTAKAKVNFLIREVFVYIGYNFSRLLYEAPTR